MIRPDEGLPLAEPADIDSHEVLPRTVRYCGSCGTYTPHELRPTGVVCSGCEEAALQYELDRD